MVAKDPTQPFVPLNTRIHLVHAWQLLYQPVVEPLMLPFVVVVIRLFAPRVAQMSLSEGDDVSQALGLDRASESLRVGIQISAARGKFYCLDA